MLTIDPAGPVDEGNDYNVGITNACGSETSQSVSLTTIDDPEPLPGDINCDDTVTVADIPPFVQALLNTGGFGGCDINRADMNMDGLINGRDTQPFVAVLLAP